MYKVIIHTNIITNDLIVINSHSSSNIDWKSPTRINSFLLFATLVHLTPKWPSLHLCTFPRVPFEHFFYPFFKPRDAPNPTIFQSLHHIHYIQLRFSFPISLFFVYLYDYDFHTSFDALNLYVMYLLYLLNFWRSMSKFLIIVSHKKTHWLMIILFGKSGIFAERFLIFLSDYM